MHLSAVPNSMSNFTNELFLWLLFKYSMIAILKSQAWEFFCGKTLVGLKKLNWKRSCAFGIGWMLWLYIKFEGHQCHSRNHYLWLVLASWKLVEIATCHLFEHYLTSTDLLTVGPSGTNSSEISIKMLKVSFFQMYFNSSWPDTVL